MKYEIRNRWDQRLQFTAEIECDDNAPTSLKIGLAVKWGNARGANLRGADLGGADLRGANLRDANLRYANLRHADLRGAYLGGANLRGADLGDADLGGANLRDAYLGDANLRDANLRGANLRGANLRDANLRDADLGDADVARLSILPDGDLIGWKRAQGAIVKLRIPTNAKRSNATGRKCRAEYAEVLEIEGGAKQVATNGIGPRTVYRVGETVYSDQWDDCCWNECSHGLHFFITREEAEEW